MKRPKNFFRSFKQKIKRCFPCINIEVADAPSAPKRRQNALKSGSEDVSVNRQQQETPPQGGVVQILENEAIAIPAFPVDKIVTVPAQPVPASKADDIEILEIPAVQFPASESDKTLEIPAVQFPASESDKTLEIPAVQFPASESDETLELPAVQFPASKADEIPELPTVKFPASEADKILELPAVKFPASEVDEIQKKEDQLAEIEQVLKRGKAIKKSQVSNLAFPEMLGLLNGLLDTFSLKCEKDSEGSTSSEVLPIIFTNTSKYDLYSYFLMFDEKYGAKFNKKGFANALQGRTVLMRSVKKWEGNYFGPGEGIIQIDGRAGNREKQKGGLSVFIVEEMMEMQTLMNLSSLKSSFPDDFTIYCNETSFYTLMSLMRRCMVSNCLNPFQFEKELNKKPIRVPGPGAMVDCEGANGTDGNLCETGVHDTQRVLVETLIGREDSEVGKDQGCEIKSYPDLLSSFGSNKATTF